MPRESVSLRNLALWAAKTQLTPLPPEPADASTLERKARLLRNLGGRLGDIGRLDDALEATRESVRLYVRLSAMRSDAVRTFIPSDLPTALIDLGKILSELGRHKEALVKTQHAIEGLRTLAEAHPEVFLPNLATSLSNCAEHLANLGQHDEALATAKEALALRRRLAASRPDKYLPDVVLSLINLGTHLGALAGPDEALAATDEATTLCRDLAESRPDRFLPTLAMCLGNLGVQLAQLRKREAAMRALQEAKHHYAFLARRYPDAFEYHLDRVQRNMVRLAAPAPSVAPGVILSSAPATLPPGPRVDYPQHEAAVFKLLPLRL
jgi:tetratricopeptide (TPR) repeat protein